MPVTREYECKMHGPFESRAEKPRCPRGCTTIQRVFLTPPGIKHTRTSNTDRLLQMDMFGKGLSDYSNKDGITAAQRRVDAIAPDMKPRFAPVGKDVGKALASTKVIPEAKHSLADASGTRGLLDVKPALQKPRTVLIAPNYNG